MTSELSQKLSSKSATIGIIGIGYVGLPLALRFSEVGLKVIGFDINQKLIETINSGKSLFNHIPDQAVQTAVASGFEVTGDFARASEVDAIILCLPTPLGVHNEPDLSAVTNSLKTVLPYLKDGVLVSLESTTYPGTTEEELLPLLAEGGKQVGKDFYLVYSPEREDPGRTSHSTSTVPKLVGGVTKECLALGEQLYALAVDEVVTTSSPKVAEMAKLHENIFRAINIGLANEMKLIADRMGIDIYEVIEAAATKPYGFTPFYPGPGLGGHCIPIDPFYLTWKAREYGHHTRFIELAGEINTSMPNYVVQKITDALNDRGKAMNGAKILLLGVAYKPNVNDTRESPALELIQLLGEARTEVSYHDPYVPALGTFRKYEINLKSEPLDEAILKAQDCVLLVTHHDDFDYDLIAAHAPLIIDTRGKFDHSQPHIIAA